jgi:sulfoxide reductase heme-binding subunit YedZ
MTAVIPPADWYLLRGSGLVALILLSLAVALGVVGVQRWSSPRWPKLVTAGLHRSIALLAVCFLGVHIVTAVLDQWVGLGWAGVLVPFLSSYRPVAVGLGAVALDLVVAVVATSLLRRRLGYRLWRAVHWGAWLLWPLAVAHGLSAGTDTWRSWGLAVCLACIALVGTAAAWRIAGSRRRRARSGGPGRSGTGRPPDPPAPSDRRELVGTGRPTGR